MDQSEIADILAGHQIELLDRPDPLAVGDVGMPDEVSEVHDPLSRSPHSKGDDSQQPQDPETNNYISIKDAVYEFGPCAGGYAKACRQILEEIANNPKFAFEWQLGLYLQWLPEPLCQAHVESEFRDGLRKVLDKIADPPEDFNYRKWLEDLGADLRVNVAQTRAIWIPQKISNMVSNANLNPYWNEYEALAWIVTRDIFIVGLFQERYQVGKLNEYLGVIKYLSLENCDGGHHENIYRCGSGAGISKWKLCQCLSNAWDDMRRFSASKAQGPISKLSFDVGKGIISLTPRSSDGEVEFLKKHIFQQFPPLDSAYNVVIGDERLIGLGNSSRPVQPASGYEPTPRAPGRPAKGKDDYLAEFHRRAESQQLKNGLAEESRYLQGWFKNLHPTAKQPTAKTIENTIRHDFWAAKSRARNPQN